MSSSDAAVRARILVIDDSDSVLQALGYYLPTIGYATLTAQGGRAGLELAIREPVQIVLLDVDMPHLNGIAVCAAIRADPALRRLPVVMMTGRATPEVVDQAMAAGATTVLSKPFDLDVLEATLANCLGRPDPPDQ